MARHSSNSPIFTTPPKTSKDRRIPRKPRAKTQPDLRGNLYQADCPTRIILNHLTSRWGLLILIVLLDRTHRFSELARRIGGVSEKMLAQSLQALEADGFVLRTVYPTVPPKVEYSLTPLGHEVAPHVKTLTNWVEDNVGHIVGLREQHTIASSSTNGSTTRSPTPVTK
jgi:DNA-binding HxlR family transcriptional regulator